MEPHTFNTSCQPRPLSLSLSLSLPSRCIRHVTHRSGFELCFPCATERRRARCPSSGDARNSWAQEGCCTRNRAARWDPSVTLLSFLLRLVVVVAVCSGGTASPPRPGPTSLPSQPAPQDPSAGHQLWCCWWWDYEGTISLGLCRVGYLSAAGICCPGVGDSSSGRVKQHMTVSPCGRMQQGNHPE